MDVEDTELLTVTVTRSGELAEVSARGEVDLVTAERLREAVESATRTHRSVIVDLSGVSFLDSTGLSVLVAADQTATPQRCRLRIVASSPAVLRPLEISGLAVTLPLSDSLDAARRSLAHT